MKKFHFVLYVLLTIHCSAQNNGHCGFLEAQDYLFKTDPLARQRFEANLKATEGDDVSNNKNTSIPSFTIPVVFHILHIGGNENISDAQVTDAMAILNKDFNKQNADTANIVAAFQGIAADCNIAFELARFDEQGNCTNGITRHYDANTNWNLSSANYKYTWNRTKYLNIYVVKSMPNGIAGYTYLPGTASAVMDAVVILQNYVGSIGTGFPYGSRALTHEVGHWFNLQHVWGSSNQPGVACGDDGVGDTPITKGFSFCNLANAAQCTAGVNENIQNYMEYAYCSLMFTQGQRNRMHNALNSSNAGRINLWSASNLNQTGVLYNAVACQPKADFAANLAVVCLGSAVPFTDYSYNGTVNNWEWSSPQASNTSILQNGVLTFTSTGLAQVKLKVSNQWGVDSVIKSDVMVLAPNGSGISNIIQSFENINFPDTAWLRSTPLYGSPFQSTSSSAKTGSNSLWVNNYFDNPNEKVSFYTPDFLFQSFAPAILTFYYAYTQKNVNNNDLFRVLASTDCGNSWTSVFAKYGSALITTGNYSSTPFVANVSDYKMESIDLSTYANQNVYLKFEFTPDLNGPGNNFFIDDINLSALVGLNEPTLSNSVLSYYPNPVKEEIILKIHPDTPITSIHLKDLMGCSFPIQIEKADKVIKITLDHDLKPGFYFLYISTVNSNTILKILKE